MNDEPLPDPSLALTPTAAPRRLQALAAVAIVAAAAGVGGGAVLAGAATGPPSTATTTVTVSQAMHDALIGEMTAMHARMSTGDMTAMHAQMPVTSMPMPPELHASHHPSTTEG